MRLSVGVGLSAHLFAQPASGGSGVELTLCTSTGQRLVSRHQQGTQYMSNQCGQKWGCGDRVSPL